MSKNLAYGMMAISAILWATSGTFTTLALDAGVKVMQITVFQAVLGAFILLPLIGIFDPKSLRIKRKDFLPLFAFSLVTGTFFSLAWFNCIDLTNVATAVILLYAYPSIVTVASVFMLSEGLTAPKALALPLTFVGCVLVAGAQDLGAGLKLDLLGVAFGVYAAFGGAAYYLWGKKFLDRYSANTVILYMTALSIPGLIVIANPIDLMMDAIPALGWFYILLLAVFPGTIGFVVSLVALRHIEASKASIIASIEPVAAVMIAYLILSERINYIQGLGVALVFGGVLVLRITERRSEKGMPSVEPILER